MDEDFVGSLIGGGVVNLQGIVTDALAIVGAAGDTFNSLNEDFGFVLFIPLSLMVAKASIGIVKSVLFFRRGRRGR